MTTKKDANRVLNDDGSYTSFPAQKVADTILQEKISSESHLSHAEAVEEILEERKTNKVLRAEQRQINDQIKLKEEKAHKRILNK